MISHILKKGRVESSHKSPTIDLKRSVLELVHTVRFILIATAVCFLLAVDYLIACDAVLVA